MAVSFRPVVRSLPKFAQRIPLNMPFYAIPAFIRFCTEPAKIHAFNGRKVRLPYVWGGGRLGVSATAISANPPDSQKSMLPAARGAIQTPIWFRNELVLAVSPSPNKRDIIWDSRKRLELIGWSSDEGPNWRKVFLTPCFSCRPQDQPFWCRNGDAP